MIKIGVTFFTGMLLSLALLLAAGQQGKQIPQKYSDRPLVVQYPPPEITIPYSLEQLHAHLRTHPNDFTAHFYLMCFYAQHGQWAQSLHHALQARRLNSSEVNAHLGTIYAYANLARDREAYEAMQAALKGAFEEVARSALLRVKGDLCMEQYTKTGNRSWLAQAWSAYQQALKTDSQNAQAAVGIARVEIERHDYRAAQQRLQRVFKHVGLQKIGGLRSKALALYYLGLIAERQGRLEEAKRLYQEAVRTHRPSFLPLTEKEVMGYLWGGMLALKYLGILRR